MAVQFKVQENMLLKNGQFYVKTGSMEEISFEKFLDHMSRDTALEKNDLRSALHLLYDNLTLLLSEGRIIETPIGTFKPTLKGTLENENDDFRPDLDSNNHTVGIRFKPAKSLLIDVRKRMSQLQRLSGSTLKMPHLKSIISKFSDIQTGVSAGAIIEVRGEDLKYNPEAADEGIYLVTNDGSESKIEQVITNTRKTQQFVMPNLANGPYQVRLKTRMGNHQLREHQLDFSIILN